MFNPPTAYATREQAIASGDSLHVSIACALAGNSSAQSIVLPAGYFLVSQSINLAGRSNIHISGAGRGLTVLVAASSLNGSDNLAFNDVIQALNWTPYDPVKGGYPNKNISVSDLTIDCTDQNFSGITPAIIAAKVGYSLAGIEIMNVDNASVERVEIIGAYGNGCVISSADPRAFDANGVRVGVSNPVMREMVFTDCLRGLLPQYNGPQTPDGITGTVIQVGAAVGGSLRDIVITRPSGPAIDRFNCLGLVVENILVDGYGLYPVGASPTSSVRFQQCVGAIRSDFGLIDCVVRDVVFRGIGGIFDTGNPLAFFQNAGIPTPGPNGCLYENIHLDNPAGVLQIPAPAIGNPMALIHHRSPGDTYTYPVLVTLIGGSGISGIIYRNGQQSPVTLPMTNNTFVMRLNDMVQLQWQTAPTWMWQLVPNIDFGGISIFGGSGDHINQQAKDNTIRNVSCRNAATNAIAIVDGYNTIIEDIVAENTGIDHAIAPILLAASYDRVGAGCYHTSLQNVDGRESRAGYPGPVSQDARSQDTMQNNVR